MNFDLYNYLSDNGNTKSGCSKWQDTTTGDREMKVLKQAQYFELNALLFLTIYSHKHLPLGNPNFNLRKYFIHFIEVVVILMKFKSLY